MYMVIKFWLHFQYGILNQTLRRGEVLTAAANIKRFSPTYLFNSGPGSVVGIATVLAKFSAPVQTGPGAHSASCKIDTGSFPR